MLSIQVVMSLLRDVRMREQAHIIQQEVVKLMDDVARLDERVRKLQLHFNQANKDVEDILDLGPESDRARRAHPHGRGRGGRAGGEACRAAAAGAAAVPRTGRRSCRSTA